MNVIVLKHVNMVPVKTQSEATSVLALKTINWYLLAMHALVIIFNSYMHFIKMNV